MKKGLLLFLGLFIMVSTAEAKEGIKSNSKKGYYNYIGTRPIQFMERGIRFYVYPNGEIDFDRQRRFRTQYYYRNGYRYKKRVPLRSTRITRDYYGRIRSVGNVFINYNRFGNVTRVGSVFIDYQRGRRLKRVGGLHISYDRFGGVRYFGQVKPQWRNDFYFNDVIYDFDDDFFYNDTFFDSYDDYGEDDDFYYYKSKGKRGQKSGKIIKRKKLKATPKGKIERKRRR